METFHCFSPSCIVLPCFWGSKPSCQQIKDDRDNLPPPMEKKLLQLSPVIPHPLWEELHSTGFARIKKGERNPLLNLPTPAILLPGTLQLVSLSLWIIDFAWQVVKEMAKIKKKATSFEFHSVKSTCSRNGCIKGQFISPHCCLIKICQVKKTKQNKKPNSSLQVTCQQRMFWHFYLAILLLRYTFPNCWWYHPFFVSHLTSGTDEWDSGNALFYLKQISAF